MTEIITDDDNSNTKTKYNDYVNKTLQGVDSDLMCQAMQRVKDYAFKNEVIGGEVAFFMSARTLKAIEEIKRERVAANEDKRKEQLKQQTELAEEFKPLEDKPPVNDSGKSDGILAEPKRIASREELQNMLYAVDKNYKFLFTQINGLNDALDVIQADMKALKDKVQMFEDIINEAKPEEK